jgi:transcriptional regulator with XRE-family HTH domain
MMMKCKHCGGGADVLHGIAPEFEAGELGAPFKVILNHAVKTETCKKCGNLLRFYVPDMKGLCHAVAFSRALEPRRLTAAEIRFMRKAMGWKAKDLAHHLGIGAEYLSRCENGQKIMAPATEKLFRIFVLLQTPDRSALDELDLSKLFDLIKIDPVWDTSNSLTFHFVRRPIVEEPVTETDEKWRKEQLKAA